MIAKFKIRQCILMTDSPNLILAKLSRYTVFAGHYDTTIAVPSIAFFPVVLIHGTSFCTCWLLLLIYTTAAKCSLIFQ